MGYASINNAYKDPRILMFKECWAMEKVHGTSCHIRWDGTQMHLFSGGCAGESFAKCFDKPALTAKLLEIFGDKPACVYGEGYGGKEQGMRDTYGATLCFIVFDVQIGEHWLDLLGAVDVATKLGLEFVPYERIPATVEAMNAARDKPSEVAVRRGCGGNTDKYGFCPPISEGVVLRPIYRIYGENGERICCKHKREEFKERGNVPKLSVDPEKLEILTEAQAIAEEWVTENRILNAKTHFKEGEWQMENFSNLLQYIVDDVYREAKGEIVEGKTTRKEVGRLAAKLLKANLTSLTPVLL